MQPFSEKESLHVYLRGPLASELKDFCEAKEMLASNVMKIAIDDFLQKRIRGENHE